MIWFLGGLRFWRESLYTRPLLHVTPTRLKLKLEHGFGNVCLVQFRRLLLGSLKDWNKRVKHDSSLGSGDDGGRKVHISMKVRVNRDVRMSG